jgi:hypothetical protein
MVTKPQSLVLFGLDDLHAKTADPLELGGVLTAAVLTRIHQGLQDCHSTQEALSATDKLYQICLKSLLRIFLRHI